MRRALGILVTIALVFGFQFWNKSRSHDKTRAHLIEVCDGEAPCVEAVESHYEDCFKAAYKMRRRAGGLDSEQLASCINQRAGEEWFVVEDE